MTPKQIACAVRADWVEHVLATGGEAYLHPIEQDLSLFVQLSLDVWAATLAAAALLLYTLLKAAQLAFAKLSAAFEQQVVLANNSSKKGN